MGDEDAEVACQAWTTKLPKAAQPNLNYMGRLERKLCLKLNIHEVSKCPELASLKAALRIVGYDFLQTSVHIV